MRMWFFRILGWFSLLMGAVCMYYLDLTQVALVWYFVGVACFIVMIADKFGKSSDRRDQ